MSKVLFYTFKNFKGVWYSQSDLKTDHAYRLGWNSQRYINIQYTFVCVFCSYSISASDYLIKNIKKRKQPLPFVTIIIKLSRGEICVANL